MDQHEPTRRQFLSGAAALSLSAGAFTTGEQRPNVLLILSDQHRHDAAGFGGAGYANTPYLDALAKAGTLVQDAYCQIALGLPSRQSLLTGQYPSSHGAFRNRGVDFQGERTLAHDFQAAGYATAWVGKTECNTSGFDRVISQDDLWESFRGQNPKALLPSAKKGRPSSGSASLRSMNLDYADLIEGPVFHMEEHVSIHAAKLLRQPLADKPSFLVASYPSPAPPLFPPQEFLELYRDADLAFEHNYRALGSEPFRDLERRRRTSGWKSLAEKQAHNIVRAYYASVAWMDDCIGSLLTELDASPSSRETLVIYTSSHGEQLGEHGLWQKRTLYDASTRVPLILRWPRTIKANQRLARVVEHLDLAASIFDLCAVKSSLDSPGRSFAPMLRGEQQEWQDRARIELSLGPPPKSPDALLAAGVLPDAGQWALRWGEWKYIEHNPEQRALFHISEDPKERNSRIHDPKQADRIQAMRSMLIAGNPKRWAYSNKRGK